MKTECPRFISRCRSALPRALAALEVCCRCWMELVPLFLSWASAYSEVRLVSIPYGVSRNRSTVTPACVPHCYPARFIEKKCETAVLTSARGGVIIKKYSKILWSPVIAIIFEALLSAKHCTGY